MIKSAGIQPSFGDSGGPTGLAHSVAIVLRTRKQKVWDESRMAAACVPPFRFPPLYFLFYVL